MKRKNILKFVSLFGIGSFVMLAAASCTKTTTATSNPNPPSDGGNINPSGSEGMNNVDPELAAARTDLTKLIDSKNQNTELYVDYAKIKDTLTKAYDDAKVVLDNSASSTQNLKDAKTSLETAINAAAQSKTDFNAAHGELVTLYNALKEELKKEEANLDSVKEDKYAAIKANFMSLYEKAKAIVTTTLDPVTGSIPEVDNVKKVNEDIMTATSRNDLWKQNADNLANSFIKSALIKKDATEADQTNTNNMQPPNWSFAGYSVDLTTTTTDTGSSSQAATLPNLNFAQRKVWTSNNIPLPTPAAEDENQKATPLTDVSWIYSLTGTGAKNTLSFRYFGASETVYLYFPYKLVKTGDSVGLQYKLNNATQPTEIAFSNEMTNNKTPTVGDIQIAKITLSNLKFNLNEIEFSVPSGKVAPMIGNMYLTTNLENTDKIYNSIFGNSVFENNSITVDLLKGYSLAADWSTVIAQYSDDNLMLDNMAKPNEKFYLVGFVGGTGARGVDSILGENVNNNNRAEREMQANVKKLPTAMSGNRNYTFYVNAPQQGNYYIKGIYASGQNRGLKFAAGNMSENNVTITGLNSNSFNAMLKTFDTSAAASTTGYVNTQNSKNTLALVKGLNKIVVSGGTEDSGNAPNFGHLTFTLMNPIMES